jgi:hypothetical protein
MKRISIVLLASALSACAAHPCGEVITERKEIVGTITYQPGSTLTPFNSEGATLDSVGRESITLGAQLKSESGPTRDVKIEISGIGVGARVLEPGGAQGKACLILQSGAEPTCLPLQGSINAARFSQNCVGNGSGIFVCADQVDVSVHASVETRGVIMKVDLEIVRLEHWTEECTL